MLITDPPQMDEEAVPEGLMHRDDALLAGIRAGKPDWAGIYRAHRDAMHRAAARELGRGRFPGAEEPNDVVSYVVRKLMASGISTEVEDLERYLVTAVVNRVRDLRRQCSVWQKDEHADGGKVRVLRESGLDEKGPDGLSVADGLLDGSMGVEELVVECLQYERVLEKLHILTPKQRQAVVERVFHERPEKDIAAELGVTPQRVSQLIRAGCKKLLLAIGYSQEGRQCPT